MKDIMHYEAPKYKINSKEGIIVGQTNVMTNLFRYLNILADKPTTVLLYGETGTGKDLCTRALHYNSTYQREGEFVAVNCDSFNAELLESELFGHVKGAFTGAYKDYPGKFMHASKGTIFLDEIGEISKPMQSKLLRVLQDKTIMPVGSNEQKQINVKIVAATNRDLAKEVKKGNFRKDLYYRLNVAPIRVPALSERQEDIPLITEYFIEDFNKQYGTNVEGLTDVAKRILKAHLWEGNIRELRSIVERAFLFRKDGSIDDYDLRFDADIPDVVSMTNKEKYTKEEKHAFDSKRAKQIRKNAKLTLEQVANTIGMKGKDAQICNFEKGKFNQQNPRGNVWNYLEFLKNKGYDFLGEAGIVE